MSDDINEKKTQLFSFVWPHSSLFLAVSLCDFCSRLDVWIFRFFVFFLLFSIELILKSPEGGGKKRSLQTLKVYGQRLCIYYELFTLNF